MGFELVGGNAPQGGGGRLVPCPAWGLAKLRMNAPAGGGKMPIFWQCSTWAWFDVQCPVWGLTKSGVNAPTELRPV